MKISFQKRFAKILAFILAFILLQSLFQWMLTPINYSHWVNKDIQTNKEEIDTAVFGSSHVFCGFDPKAFDKKVGTCTINCGSASQKIQDSYFYLLNIKKKCPNLKNVIVDVHFSNLIKTHSSNASEMQRKMVLSDRISNPFVKLEYIISTFKINEYPFALFPSLYYSSNISTAYDTVKAKLSSDYRNYNPEMSVLAEPYKYMGYIPYEYNTHDNLEINKNVEFNFDIDKDSTDYLIKIINFCKKNNINLMFIQMPISKTAYKQTEKYAEYYNDIIKKITVENDIPFLGMNDNFFSFSDDKHFYVAEHLNDKGAEIATDYCSEFFLSNF